MGLLDNLLGKKTASRKRKKLVAPKANATTKQMQTYVNKRTKQLETAVKKEQLKAQVAQLNNITAAEIVSKGKRR